MSGSSQIDKVIFMKAKDNVEMMKKALFLIVIFVPIFLLASGCQMTTVPDDPGEDNVDDGQDLPPRNNSDGVQGEPGEMDKYFVDYSDGTVIYNITQTKPTPCHEIIVDEQVMESYPVQIRLDIQIREPEEGTMCAQVIDTEKLSGKIEVGHKPGQFTVVVDGDEVYSSGFDSKSISPDTEADLERSCDDLGGSWIEEARECEGISEESCDDLGGNFNPCASACRNDPDAEYCTMQCVLVCGFDETEDNTTEPIEEPERHYCTDEEIESKMCTKEYMPVCGDNNVTYENGCTACSSEEIEYWEMGEC